MWLCHVSNMWEKFTGGLSNHFKVGEKLRCVISSIWADGKIAVKRLK